MEKRKIRKLEHEFIRSNVWVTTIPETDKRNIKHVNPENFSEPRDMNFHIERVSRQWKKIHTNGYLHDRSQIRMALDFSAATWKAKR